MKYLLVNLELWKRSGLGECRLIAFDSSESSRPEISIWPMMYSFSYLSCRGVTIIWNNIVMGWNLMICISEFKFLKNYSFILFSSFSLLHSSSGWVTWNSSLPGVYPATVLYPSHCGSNRILVCVYAQLYVTLQLHGRSPPGSSGYGTFQARRLEQIAISDSRGSSQPSERTHISCSCCTGRHVLYHCTTWETTYRILRWPSVFPTLWVRDLQSLYFWNHPPNFPGHFQIFQLEFNEVNSANQFHLEG